MGKTDFDKDFDNWMSAAIEYERLTRYEKPIPRKLQKCMYEAGDWLNNLSYEEYSNLIY